MRRAVITGPTGAIGTALAGKLLREGAEVLAVVRRGSKRLDRMPQHPRLRILEADQEEYAGLTLPGGSERLRNLHRRGIPGGVRQA